MTPWLRVWLAIHQPCFSPRTNPVRDFRFRLISDDGGARPESKKRGRCSVSSASPHIAFQQAEGARRAFQRGHPRNCSEDVYLYGLAAFFGVFRAHKTRSERIHSLQASQNELAEPFKYSNTLHPSSTIVCCIPLMTASETSQHDFERAAQADTATIRDASVRSGFRLRARTHAQRLNLLKRFAASTLGNFQSEYTI
jgi:hypothetical protein